MGAEDIFLLAIGRADPEFTGKTRGGGPTPRSLRTFLDYPRRAMRNWRARVVAALAGIGIQEGDLEVYGGCAAPSGEVGISQPEAEWHKRRPALIAKPDASGA